MRCAALLILASLLLLPQIGFGVFTDQSEIPSWSETSIDRVKYFKIMTGFGDGTFRPDQNLNRVEALAILLRAKNVGGDKIDLTKFDPQTKFVDVPEDAWFAPLVAAGSELGWVSGVSNHVFRPSDPVNRATWATLISRVFDLGDAEEKSFKDVPSKSWFAEPVWKMEANDLIREKNPEFQPEKMISRADAAWTISQILQMPRLMETSAENNFSESTRRDARRTAIKPKDFNAEKQGYDIEPQSLWGSAIPIAESVEITAGDDWTDLGVFSLENTFDDRITVSSVELRLRFLASNVGPAQNFQIRIQAGKEVFESDFLRGGKFFLTGKEWNILAGGKKKLVVQVRPKSGESFYSKSGEAVLSLIDTHATMISRFADREATQQYNYRTTPVRFRSRDLAKIFFSP